MTVREKLITCEKSPQIILQYLETNFICFLIRDVILFIQCFTYIQFYGNTVFLSSQKIDCQFNSRDNEESFQPSCFCSCRHLRLKHENERRIYNYWHELVRTKSKRSDKESTPKERKITVDKLTEPLGKKSARIVRM